MTAPQIPRPTALTLRLDINAITREGSPSSTPATSSSPGSPQPKDTFSLQCFCFQVGVPPGTWAFCLSTLIFLLLTTNNPAIYKLPLSEVTYPEANRVYYLTVKSREEEKSPSGD